MLLVSYPEIKEEGLLPVYVTGIGIDYPQETASYSNAGSAQFLFSAEGSGELVIGGNTYDLPAGSGVYLSGTSGCLYRPNPREKEAGWTINWLTFGFGDGMASCREMLFLGKEWCLFEARRRDEHSRMMREIYRAVTLDGTYGAHKASALLYGMLVELNGELEGAIGKIGCRNPALESIIAYIDENYTHDITLDQLCTAAGGLSEQYLCRLFKQSTGMRPMEYMLRRRINAARTYLEKTDLPISEVAARSGFNNTSYFYRNFRKFVGLSPLAYRQSALGVE